MASRMNGKRRKLTAEFKTKVVLEALKEKMTLTELSQKIRGIWNSNKHMEE
ncbi:MAG: hypothetical protein R2774_09905 [Saprospiraceae bacterium]